MTIIRFIHISDSHIGPDKKYELKGLNSHDRLRAVVDTISNLPYTPDFIIHTGDLAYDPDDNAYNLATSELKRLKIPIYYAVGNHDSPEWIFKLLSATKEQNNFQKYDSAYSFSIKKVTFLVLDASGTKDIDPRGRINDEQLNICKDFCRGTQHLVIFLHYPPISLDSQWFDENMLIENGEDLHSILKNANCKIHGVFFGHIHRASQILRDGILYSCAPAISCQFSVMPHDEDAIPDIIQPPGFNLISIDNDTVRIKLYCVK